MNTENTTPKADSERLPDAPCSAAGEPRARTLLRSMIAALDRADEGTFFECFSLLSNVILEMLEPPNDPTETHATKTEKPTEVAPQTGGVSSPVPGSGLPERP